MSSLGRKPSLEGRIEHRLSLTDSSSDWSLHKKRKFDGESAHCRAATDVGFVLLDHPQEYLLVVPRQLLKVVCDAARYQCRVLVTRFCISPRDENATNAKQLQVLEIHEFGLKLLDRPPASDVVWNDALSLSSFLELEIDKAFAKTKPPSNFAVRGKVEAISPIIALVPSDPFALVELWDDNARLSCVVVLKGSEALISHAGILPGEEVVVHGATHQKWKVPVATARLKVTRLSGRIPSSVLVVTASTSIVWNVCPGAESSVPGEVLGVVKTSRKSERAGVQTPHCLEVGLQDGGLATISLSGFPMSPALQLGLRANARVCASNLHRLPLNDTGTPPTSYYGACLRSTVVITRTASECGEAPPRFASQKRAPIPYKFSRIRRSCISDFLEQWIRERACKLPSLKIDSAFKVFNLVFSLARRPFEPKPNVEGWRAVAEMDDSIKDKGRRRDPYAEFFDHGCSHGGGSCSSCSFGCYMSSFDTAAKLKLPNFLCPSDIHKASFSAAINTLRSHGKDIPSGGTLSVQLANEKLLHDNNFNIDGQFCLCIGTTRPDGEGNTGYLSDSVCQIPVSAVGNQIVYPSKLAVAQLDCCIVSFVCLGPIPQRQDDGQESDDTNPNQTELNAWDRSGPGIKGSSVVLKLHGKLFMGSVHLHVSNSSWGSSRGTVPAPRSSLTVEDCLKKPVLAGETHPPDHMFASLLVRSRMKLTKLRHGCFTGFTCTLCHQDNVSASNSGASLIQSIELKVHEDCGASAGHSQELLRAFRRLFGTQGTGSLLEEQIDSALAWWKLSDTARTSVLVGAGLDDVNLKQVTHRRLIPKILTPLTARCNGSHGYLRFRCKAGDLMASLVRVGSGEALETISFGGTKFLPGMLDRTPARRVAPHARFGPLRQNENAAGIERRTLADLHWDICADIRCHTQSQLAPSMVRAIGNATVLSLAFCKAQAECSRCFRPLVRTATTNQSEPVSGIVSCIPLNQKSYWDVPSANLCEDQKTQTPKRWLRCPNHCVGSKGMDDDGAAIKWECSVILDDGSGQAKLYAEREAALLLLNMSEPTRHLVEEGAWTTPDGIVFQKSLPPKSFVKVAVYEAQSLLRSQRMKRNKSRTKKSSEEEEKDQLLRLMTPLARGEYMLQHHCRTFQSKKSMDYYVRCKPLAENALHLHQTQVDASVAPTKRIFTANTMDVPTYSLPPLKLQLVDCAVSQDIPIRETCWELVDKLNRKWGQA